MDLQQDRTDVRENQDIPFDGSEQSQNLKGFGNGKAEGFHVADKLKNGVGTGLMVLGGIGAGMLLMYMLDPQQGRRRRALVRDKAVKVKNKTANTIGKKSRDLRNRAQGVLAGAKKIMPGNGKEESTAIENTQESSARGREQEQSVQA